MPAAATPNTCVNASENWVKLEKCTVTERTDDDDDDDSTCPLVKSIRRQQRPATLHYPTRDR